MQTEMRPLYDMVEKMRGTLRVLRGAEAILESLNKRENLNIDDELRICRTAPRDLFSNNSIDSFIFNLLVLIMRQIYQYQNGNKILRIYQPVDLSDFIIEYPETEDLLDLVLNSEQFSEFTLHECVEAVYSAIKGAEILLDRNSERKTYTKTNDRFALSALPLKMKVK